jgi:hypothetical protein
MENNFNNREFEQFVKQNADQYRMFPSEKVWKGIHHTLHTRRRWYGLGLILLLLTSVSVTWVMMSSAGKNQSEADLTNSASALSAPANGAVTEKAIAKPVAPPAPVVNPNTSASVNNKTTELFPVDFVTGAPGQIATTGDLSANKESETTLTVAMNPSPHPVTAITGIPATKTVAEQTAIVSEKELAAAQPPVVNAVRETMTNPGVTGDNNGESLKSSGQKIITITDNREIPAFVSNKSAIRKKMSWQLYVTPTISYRRLEENSDFINASRASAVTPGNYIMLTDVNSVVTHKPDLGLQLGVTAGYPVARNLRLLAGLQFNVSKYNIKAYKHSFEVATIALDNGYYTSSVSTYTNYRNFGGYSSDWLHNLYISASAPLGMEWTVSNKGKTQFGVSGTLQPSYILGERAYLLSTDYKNYAEVPSLTRRWNMNTSFEAFAGYKTGKLSWRIGPQVRYQLMSSFKEKYPVKEHLFDFGLKMGVQITK